MSGAPSPSLSKIDNIDFSQLKFSNLRGKTGRRFINVFYDKKVLQIALPKLRIPFDSRISPYGAVELNLSLDSRENLIKSFEKLDEEMVKFAKENKWFNDDNFRYIPVLKRSDSDKYPPTIKLKFTKKDGEYVTRIYDHEKKEVNITNDSDVVDVLKKGSMVISLIEFAGVWFSNLNGVETFGVFWKLDHIRTYPAPEKIDKMSEYIFEDSSGSDMDDYAFSE